jgi:hypothetical protein
MHHRKQASKNERDKARAEDDLRRLQHVKIYSSTNVRIRCSTGSNVDYNIAFTSIVFCGCICTV